MNDREYAFAGWLFTGTILFLVFVEAFGLQGFVSKLIGTDDYVFKVAYSQVVFFIPVAVYLFAVRKYIHAYDKGVLSEILIRTRISCPGVSDIFFSTVAGFAILPFLYLVNYLSLLSVKDVTSERAAEAAKHYPMAVMLLVVAVLAPFVEEISYRGIYFGVYSKKGVLPAALLTAVMFGLMHANLNQFAYAVTAGFIMAMFSYAGISIVCSFIIHFIVNGSSVAAIYYPGNPLNRLLNVSSLKFAVIMKKLALPAVIGLGIAAFCFYMMRKKTEKQSANNSDTTRKFFSGEDIVLLMGMFVMLVNMIANEFVK